MAWTRVGKAACYDLQLQTALPATRPRRLYVEGNGGDIVLQPGGVGAGGNYGGVLVMKDSEGNNMVSLTGDEVRSTPLETQELMLARTPFRQLVPSQRRP